MPDRELLLERLERLAIVLDELMPQCAELVRDAITLLKEHEPVEPIKLENWWKCPSCSGNIVSNMKYCPGCGREVKWNA